MNILLLIDYRNQFYSSTKKRGGSMDLELLKKYFNEQSHVLDIKYFHEIDFRNKNYKNVPVLYQSSEDPSLHYKDYIEDIILGLHYQGAILIPDFFKFRAHHNKVFMEIIRDINNYSPIQKIKSKGFGSLEDFLRYSEQIQLPSVIKPGSGSKSRRVSLARTKEKMIDNIRKISKTPTLTNLKLAILNLFDRKGYKKTSQNRKKFIIQNFIQNLSGDYKILVYSDKYYVLSRKNRTNDFRASGSGKLSYPKNPPKELLDYAEKVFRHFDVPFISIDIAKKEDVYYLLEFQFLSFGQYTLEKSKFYFTKKYDKWEKINKQSTLEKQFAESISLYIKKII